MRIVLTLLALASLLSFSQGSLAGGDIAAGREKNKSMGCITCHGEFGNSPSPSDQPVQPPLLAGQHADYLVKTLEDYASGERKSPFMVGFAATLNAQDRADLAAFYAAQDGLEVIEYDK